MDGSITRAAAMGEWAHRCLRPGTRGQVVARLTSTVYLQWDPGGIVWIAPEDSPFHRRALLTIDRLTHVELGEGARIEGTALAFEAGGRVELSGSSVARATRAVAEGESAGAGEIALRLAELGRAAVMVDTPRGFGLFLPHLLRSNGIPRDEDGRAWKNPILQFAWPIVHTLDSIALGKAPLSRLAEARSLIGLGPGLTPSGDDFLGGFLFVWHHLHQTFHWLPRPPSPRSLLRAESPRTNAISMALLRDLAYGEGVAPLHELTAGILRGAPRQDSHGELKRLLQLGHSTGWDLFAGVIVGFGFSIRALSPRSSAALRPGILPGRAIKGNHGHQTAH